MSGTRPITPNELARLFPKCSKSTHEKNSSDPDDGSEVPDAKPQRDEATALGAAIPGEDESLRRVRVRFVGYRIRPLDPDNFAGSVKDCLDFLRHVHLIEGDEPWRIILETEQIKVRRYRDQKTVIIIFS